MSFNFTGAVTSYLRRQTGNVTNTNNFTCAFWVKRTANFSGIKALWAVVPPSDDDGHGLYCNDPGEDPYSLDLQVNFATQQAKADPVPLNVWTYIAIVGSGANISLKYWDGSEFVTSTVSQTAFAVGSVRLGDFGGNAHLFTGLMAHVRWWNGALNNTELEAEKNSASAVRSSGLVSAHSGGGGSISAALVGEVGADYVNMGAASYSSDAPTFDSFNGAVISGESYMPSVVTVAPGARVNRMLYSGDLTNSVWVKQGNSILSTAVSAPGGFGASGRVRINTDVGGVYQRLTGIPEGHQVAVMAARRVDADFVCFRHMNGTFSAGQQGIFNLATGAWAYSGGFGGVSGGTFGSRALGNGWYLIWISATLSGDRVVEFYPTATADQLPASGRHIDVAAFQQEDVVDSVKATYHKPTTSARASRTLASGTMILSVGSIGVAQSLTATAQFLDNTGAPWDQASTVFFSSDSTGVATVASDVTSTDLSGRATATVTGVSVGTADITATLNDITTSAAEVNVDVVSVTRRVRILVEPGWQGTSGWHVGVYEKPTTSRFPSVKLFEASGQSFNASLMGDQSYMDVPVPSAVSVTLGQDVEVALENDNVDGRAVDGPGIFPATVI